MRIGSNKTGATGGEENGFFTRAEVAGAFDLNIQAAAILALSFVVAPAFAEKNCEELKSEISAKLEAKGVKGYTLDIIATEEVKDQKIVGSCEVGKKKITYKKD